VRCIVHSFPLRSAGKGKSTRACAVARESRIGHGKNAMRCREETLRKIESSSFDVCVIGGGATGAGSARKSGMAPTKWP
jgi:hypothetical protein